MSAELPEVTEVQRVTIRPGDRVVVRIARVPSDYEADRVLEQVSGILGVARDRILLLDPRVSVEIATAEGDTGG